MIRWFNISLHLPRRFNKVKSLKRWVSAQAIRQELTNQENKIMKTLTVEQIKTELNNTVYSGETYKRIFALTNELRVRLLPTEEIAYNVEGYEERQVEPSDFKIGDLMASHGYICKVDEILRFPNERDQEFYGDTFVFLCTYVCGDLNGAGSFKYFLESTNNGCDRGYRSHEQGNKLAKWSKLFKV